MARIAPDSACFTLSVPALYISELYISELYISASLVALPQ